MARKRAPNKGKKCSRYKTDKNGVRRCAKFGPKKAATKRRRRR